MTEKVSGRVNSCALVWRMSLSTGARAEELSSLLARHTDVKRIAIFPRWDMSPARNWRFSTNAGRFATSMQLAQACNWHKRSYLFISLIINHLQSLHGTYSFSRGGELVDSSRAADDIWFAAGVSRFHAMKTALRQVPRRTFLVKVPRGALKNQTIPPPSCRGIKERQA